MSASSIFARMKFGRYPVMATESSMSRLGVIVQTYSFIKVIAFHGVGLVYFLQSSSAALLVSVTQTVKSYCLIFL